MRALTTTLLLACLALSHAQLPTSLVLTPRWKVGDNRKVHVTEMRTEVKDGVSVGKREETDLDMRVVNDDVHNFMLRIETGNVVLRAARSMTSAIGSEMAPWERVTLRYAVSKKDGTARLVNWAEARQFMEKSHAEVLKHLTGLHPKAGAEFSDVAAPLLEAFKDSAGVALHFASTVGYATFPYGKQLVLGDTTRFTEYVANPFTGPDSMKVSTRSLLKEMDREKQTCLIEAQRQLDEKALLEATRQMMIAALTARTDDPAERKKAEAKVNADLKGARFDLAVKSAYRVDIKTTWPTEISSSTRTLTTQGGRTVESTATSTVVFNR